MAQQGNGERERTYCEPYYHMETFAQLKVYLYAIRVTRGGGDGREFYSADANTARKTNLCLESTRVARRGLARAGWLVLLCPGQGLGRPNRYRVLGHDVWAELHPGRCCK